MDHQVTADMTAASENATSLGGKSWTAYMRVVIIGLVLLAVATPVAAHFSPLAGVIVGLASAGYVVYKIMDLHSYELYYDVNGVWLSSGVLPWQKGVTGVKWRDIADAVFYRSLSSWLFKSYDIRISQRFTEHSEIVLTSWSRGDEVVTTINTHLQRLAAGGVR